MIFFTCCPEAGAVEINNELIGFVNFSGVDDGKIYTLMTVQQEYRQNSDSNPALVWAGWEFVNGQCIGARVTGGSTFQLPPDYPTPFEYICRGVVEAFATGATWTNGISNGGITLTSRWTSTFGSTTHIVQTVMTLTSPVEASAASAIEFACSRADELFAEVNMTENEEWRETWLNGVRTTQAKYVRAGWYAHRYACDRTEPVPEYGAGDFWCFAACVYKQFPPRVCPMKMRRIVASCRKFSLTGYQFASGQTIIGLNWRSGVVGYAPAGCANTCAANPPAPCTCTVTWIDPPAFQAQQCFDGLIEATEDNTQITVVEG